VIGGKQLGFTDYELTTAKKRTKREKFLAEMEAVVPWQALIDLIEPHYPKTSKKGGRPPYLLATMLRIHLLQQWYSLSDPAMEEALIEVPTMRRFVGIDLISDSIPDETTILSLRHLLEKHELGEQIFDTVKAHLSERGMTMRHGTIVDATLIAAPSSTKNKAGKRDLEMHQTKKGNQWYFGMKVHAGVDKDSGPFARFLCPFGCPKPSPGPDGGGGGSCCPSVRSREAWDAQACSRVPLKNAHR
jgi:IS5 family transposase